MDFPEGAKVLNVSIDLGVHGRDAAPRPPVEAYLRVIDEPVLRLISVDLGATADITNLAEVFDFAKDYLGLLKAAVIAAGIVPPGIEGSGQSLADLLARIVGPGRGLEIVSNVNNIPKGSRLAVSTTLLAALISVCMRATGQAASLTGPLQEHERRLVLARALLGEWLGGSGGGWQDSGGVWPGMKLIEGVLAGEGDPEFGISRGRLMPQHRILDQHDASPETRRQACRTAWSSSTAAWRRTSGRSSKWSPRNTCCARDAEWKARQACHGHPGRDPRRACATATCSASAPRPRGTSASRSRPSFPGPPIYFTETLIRRVRAEFGERFLGLLDAGRHVRRRHGLHLRAGAEGARAGAPAGDHVRHQTRAAERPALRHGAGGL